MSDSQEQKSYYVIDDVQYPRVTNILQVLEKPGLARWRGRLGNAAADAKSKEGSDIGTRFHALAADINRGEHLTRGWQPPGEFRDMAFAYIDWLHKYVVSIEGVERRVHSVTRNYAGTGDLFATFRGDEYTSIIDVKTSNYVALDWPLQLSAYKQGAEEMGDNIARRVIVRVPKSAPYDVVMYDYKNHEEDEAAWDAARYAWRWLQEDKQRHEDALVRGGL